MIARADIIRVLDTSALVHDPSSIYSYEDDIHVTFTVLEELDNLKDRTEKNVSGEARQCINNLERIVSGYSKEELQAGVPIHIESPEAPGKLIIGLDTVLELERSLSKGIGSFADNSIINYALHLKNTQRKQVMLVSRDVNMRLKARTLGLEASDVYDTSGASNNIKDSDYVYQGVGHIEGDIFDKAVDEDDIKVDGDEVYRFPRTWFPEEIHTNFYWYDDAEQVGMLIRITPDYVYSTLVGNENASVFGIKPRNMRQKIALDQLMHKDFDLNVMLGGAGSGKTLLAMAAALHMVMDLKLYKGIVVFRSKGLMDEDPGALPGTLEEKNVPLLGGITSAVDYLLDNDEKDAPISGWSYLIDRGIVEIGSVSHSLGASHQGKIVIIDEFQNLSHAQAKGMLSRIGEGSRLIILGNLGQIWSRFVSVNSSGLKRAVEVYSKYDNAGIVMFDEVVRSRLAAFTEDNF
jgi:PhoH-like ATPase